MIYLSEAYYQRVTRRTRGEWLTDASLAIGMWALIALGVAAAVLPIWV